MKESIWMYIFISLGIFTIVVMMLVQDLTTTSEEDFYLSKEVMEAAMIDSVDLGVYRDTGEIRIIESKFVENFTRRFAESVNNSKNYTLEFYEIYECPPKATVLIKTNSRTVRVTSEDVSYDIITAISGILESKDSQTVLANTPISVIVEGGSSSNTSSSERYSIFKIIPDLGYTVDNMSVRCTDGSLPIISEAKLTLEKTSRTKTCYVTLKKIANYVTLNLTNGDLKSAAKVGVPEGGEATFKIAAKEGYTLEGMNDGTCTGGASYSINEGIVTVSNVNSSQECNIVLNATNKNVKVIVDGNKGMINGSYTYTLAMSYSDVVELKVVPNKYWETENMRVECDSIAAMVNNDQITLSRAIGSPTCTVYLPIPTRIDDYWLLTSDNKVSHYSKYKQETNGEYYLESNYSLVDTKTFNNTFTPEYARTYTIELHGGGGHGGYYSFTSGSHYGLFNSNKYDDASASGGGGGASGQIYNSIRLDTSPYTASVGRAASNASETSGNTRFGDYSIQGGENGARGYTNNTGTAHVGYQGKSFGNLTDNNTNSYSWNYNYQYTYKSASGGATVGNYGNGGKGGTSYSDGPTKGEDGMIKLTITGK